MRFVLSEDAQKELNELMERKGFDPNEIYKEVIVLDLTDFGKYENRFSLCGPTWQGDKVKNPEVHVTGHFSFKFNTNEETR